MDGRSSPLPCAGSRSSSTPPQWRARAGQLRSARWSASVFSAISHSGRCAACASKPSLASAQRQSSAQTFVDGISRLCIMSVVRFIVTGSVRICIRIQELLRIQTDVRVIRTRHTNITTAHTRKQAQSTTDTHADLRLKGTGCGFRGHAAAPDACGHGRAAQPPRHGHLHPPLLNTGHSITTQWHGSARTQSDAASGDPHDEGWRRRRRAHRLRDDVRRLQTARKRHRSNMWSAEGSGAALRTLLQACAGGGARGYARHASGREGWGWLG